MKKTNERGFTLIELLVVISIIGLLSTMAVISLNSARSKARDAVRTTDVKNIVTALEMAASNSSTGAYNTFTSGVACDNSGTTLSDVSNNVCSGKSLISNGSTLLVSIGSSTTSFMATTTATGYCVKVALEAPAGNYFKCSAGSKCTNNAINGCE